MDVKRLATVLALLMLGGCSWLHNWNTATLSYGVGDLYRNQVVHNLQAFIDDPNAVPSGVNITSGSVGTQTSANAGATIPLGDNNTILTNTNGTATTLVQPSPGITAGVSGQLTENWSLTPVTDPSAVARLKALYRYETRGLPKNVLTDPNVTDDMADAEFKKEYPISYLTKEITVPINRKCGDNKPCTINTTVVIQYPDPQAVDFPECALCEVIVDGSGSAASVSGRHVDLSDGKCAVLSNGMIQTFVMAPYAQLDDEHLKNPSKSLFYRNCRLTRWLNVVERGKTPSGLVTLGVSRNFEWYANNNAPTPLSDFTLFVMNASRSPSSPSPAPSANKFGGS